MSDRFHLELSPEALAYTWRQLAQRAGVSFTQDAMTGFEELGIPVFYGVPEQAQFASPGLIIRCCAEDAWNNLLTAPENNLTWIPIKNTLPKEGKLSLDNPIPVLFWGDGYESGSYPFVERGQDGSVIFNADIVAATFFMLTRWEENEVPLIKV